MILDVFSGTEDEEKGQDGKWEHSRQGKRKNAGEGELKNGNNFPNIKY